LTTFSESLSKKLCADELNHNISVAETCFLGSGKLKDVADTNREQLYQVLDQDVGTQEAAQAEADMLAQAQQGTEPGDHVRQDTGLSGW